MGSFRNVILCADDFGLADGVSRGIVELAEMGRLSATGAMTNMPGLRWAFTSTSRRDGHSDRCRRLLRQVFFPA